jgi:glycosyltransferase involved in cell wall biosynthesis
MNRLAPATNGSRANGAARHAVRIFLVGSEFYRSEGGIQYVNRLLVRAFEEFAAKAPVHLEIFAYGDRREDLDGPGHSHAHTRWHALERSRSALAWRLAQRTVAASPHLVLFTHVRLLALAALVRRFAPRAQTALLAHGVEVWGALDGAVQRELRRVPHIVAPSRYTAGRLADVQGVALERMRVLPHGLQPEWGESSVGSPPARNGRRILTVARLAAADAYKGVDTVIRALPYVLSRCPGARLVIAGNGDDRTRLEALAQDVGIARTVEFCGALRDGDLLRAYRDADVFALPSTGEGFGIVFLEAMHCELPVVAARAGAAPEVVADGETGILVEPGSVEGVGSALSGLLLLAEERRRMGVAGRHRVASKFLFEHFAARWHRWLAATIPHAVYLARHAAVFARQASVPQATDRTAGLPAARITKS